MDPKTADAETLFRTFTACPNDPKTLLLDVRPNKDFKRRHINQAFNVRLSSNGRVLADYSQSTYSISWSQDCWWNRAVIVYGSAGLSKDHPVVSFLAREGRCKSLHYYKDGYDAFESKYPFLGTPSVKANSIKKYPSLILSDFLYLGDWAHAEDTDRLAEIKIKRMITIHNHPDNLKPPTTIKHLKLELADVETADISKHFNQAYAFLEEARQANQGEGRGGWSALLSAHLAVHRQWHIALRWLLQAEGISRHVPVPSVHGSGVLLHPSVHGSGVLLHPSVHGSGVLLHPSVHGSGVLLHPSVHGSGVLLHPSVHGSGVLQQQPQGSRCW
eukprot:jgi/Chrzof1/398/Cz01g14120.t1